jgi:anaerobic dimethyl sulfoxide reductase subunit C (anchor subunit)
MMGLETALNERTLVFFTTIAPSGAMACMVMALVLLIGKPSEEERARINLFLCVPLAVTMIGLVASATHLGNPSNALYVFMGVGRSPLSNEVFSAVIFLGVTATYWFRTFSLHRHVFLEKLWLGLLIMSGAGFITGISAAYAFDTIVTWDSLSVVIGLWMNSLVGGPILALCTLRLARVGTGRGFLEKSLSLASAIALVINVVVLMVQNAELAVMHNSIVSVGDLIGSFILYIVAFFALAICGISSMLVPIFYSRNHQDEDTSHQPYSAARTIFACALVFAGIFIVRFVFYMMHMTVGLAY